MFMFSLLQKLRLVQKDLGLDLIMLSFCISSLHNVREMES
jgi:hypothetical protein